MTEVHTETILSRPRWSLAAVSHALGRIARRPSSALETAAEKSWEIAPCETSIAPPACFLPNQLDRVTRWEFATEHPSLAMNGGNEVIHRATRGFLLKDVWLLDGALYKNDARLWLQPRSGRFPPIRVETEIERGALFCSALGNRYFGSWLIEDCVTYPLASHEGIPVTTAKAVKLNPAGQPVLTHAQYYEDWLGMQPTRLHNAFFRELVVFDDVGQNRSKHLRFRSMHERLISHVKVTPHPGVFILRGNTGDLRVLHNELELAEHLRKQRGFRILDITKADVPTIMETCAGAQIVAGVEGSQLVHGLLALRPGGSLLTLQLPDRFVQIFKDMTDRDSQQYGFVVVHPEDKGYRVDIEEVDRTLDLFPKQG